MVKLIFHEIKLLANGFSIIFIITDFLYISHIFYEMSIKVGMNAESMVRTQRDLHIRMEKDT